MTKATSLYLDLIRVLAAVVVVLSHISQLAPGQFGALASLGVQAVDVFFVLSGFVIAYATATREREWKQYFVSRAARMYSVVIPAILVSIVCDFIGRHISPALYDDHYQGYSLGVLTRTILFLNQQWNKLRYPGSDSPFWSLGFEVPYYVIFGMLIFGRSWLRVIAIVAIMLVLGPKVALMFPVWLMGLAVYRLTLSASLSPPPPRALAWALLIGPVLALILYQFVRISNYRQPFMPLTLEALRLLSYLQDYFIGAIFSIHLIGVHLLSDVLAPALAKIGGGIRWLSGGTFSIYLYHLPLLYLLAAISPIPRNTLTSAVMATALTIAFCYALAEMTERRKELWRRAIECGLQAVLRTTKFSAG